MFLIQLNDRSAFSLTTVSQPVNEEGMPVGKGFKIQCPAQTCLWNIICAYAPHLFSLRIYLTECRMLCVEQIAVFFFF